ncbi:MAG: hypothetical protein R2820_07985 [Cyclobacteriaceae bacterium]
MKSNTQTKLIAVLTVAVIGLLLSVSSCKDDDDPSPLIGTWEEKSYVASGCIDPDDNETFTCTSSCETIVITENTIKIDTDPAIPYTTDGNKLTISQTTGGITISITVQFSVSGNTLTITQEEEDADGGCTSVSTYQRV